MMKVGMQSADPREGTLHQGQAGEPMSSASSSTLSRFTEVRRMRGEARRKKSSSIEFGFLPRAAASEGIVPTRREITNSFEYMVRIRTTTTFLFNPFIPPHLRKKDNNSPFKFTFNNHPSQ